MEIKMIKITNDITLDVVRDNIGSTVNAKQNDVSSRFIRAIITADRRELSLPKNSLAVINALRPDGASGGFSGSVGDDGTVTVPITPWILGVCGAVKCDISVFDGDKRLTTMPFFINVEESLYEGEAITDDESYGILSALIKDVREISLCEEERRAAEISRTEAEAERNAAESRRAVFTPSVSADGVLSWTNDKGLENPAPVSVKGEKGDTPARGRDYWTEADKTEIINNVLQLLPSAEEVEF